MNYPIQFQPIQRNHLNQNHIDLDLVKKMLKETISECPFSTFPYFFGNNSNQAQKLYKTGNCIAMSIYLKNKLQKHGIKSFLIPASIPKMYQLPEFLYISHVALAILLNQNKAYVCDPAFYFHEPMTVNLNHNPIKKILSQNIYEDIPETLEYQLQMQPPTQFNEYQNIPIDTYYIHTKKQIDPLDTWNYYIIEIKNPDESIGSNFLNAKKFPFITCINPKYQLELNIRFTDLHNLSIKHNGTHIYEGNPLKIPTHIHKIIKPCLIRHFGKKYRQIFNIPHDRSSSFHVLDS